MYTLILRGARAQTPPHKRGTNTTLYAIQGEGVPGGTMHAHLPLTHNRTHTRVVQKFSVVRGGQTDEGAEARRCAVVVSGAEAGGR